MNSEYIIALGAIVFVFILFLVLKFFNKNQAFWEHRGVKTLKLQNVILRTYQGKTFLDTDIGLYEQMNDLKFGGVHEAGYNICVVKDLDLAKHIFVKDFDHFVNRRSIEVHDTIWNDMVLNKLDKEWKDLRGTMSPAFSTGKIRNLFPLLKQSADRFSDYVKSIIDKKGEINIEDALGRYCMDGICSVAFGIESEIFKDENSIVADKANKISLKFNNFTMIILFVFSILPKFLQKYQPPFLNPEGKEFFTKVLLDTIQQRENSGERRWDFLQMMIDVKHGQLAKDEDDKLDDYEKDAQIIGKSGKGVEITNNLIVANCLLFIFGGFDSTKAALTFAAYLLAVNPEVQKKLRDELESAIDSEGGEFSFDICNNHDYLDWVTKEVMRMYPPGVRLERMCTKDYQIPNTNSIIPKGSLVWFPVYQFHHDEQHFPNPSKFEPKRFSPEEKAKRNPYAYVPFGHGPRICIANRFAMIQTKAAIASLVLNFDLSSTEKTPVPMTFAKSGGLRPSGDIHLKLHSRKH